MKVSLLCSRRHLNSAQVFLWEGAGWTLFLEWKNKSTSCFKFALGLVNSLHLSSLMKLTLEYILTSMNIYWPPQKHQEAWKTKSLKTSQAKSRHSQGGRYTDRWHQNELVWYGHVWIPLELGHCFVLIMWLLTDGARFVQDLLIHFFHTEKSVSSNIYKIIL